MTVIQIAAGRKESIVHQVTLHQSGGYGLKTSQCGPLFWSIFDNSRKTNSQAFQALSVSFALRLNKSFNHTRVQASSSQHMLLSPGPVPYSKCWKQGTRLGDCHWQNPRKKKYREHSNIKLSMSVHWLAQCHTKWPRGCREFQHPAGIETISPDSLWLALST